VQDPAPLYRKADVFVLTSDHEGTPNVILEAMACGLPVVATAVGGVPDLVQDGVTGFLCAPRDTAGIVAALARLAGDPVLRREMGERARVHVERCHARDRLPDLLESLYRTALV